MIYKYCNPGNDFAIFRVGDVLEHGPTPNIEVHIWHPAVDLRCRNPPRHLSQINGHDNTFEVNPKWASTLPSGIFHEILKEDPPTPPNFV
jgi:hypothetical protein